VVEAASSNGVLIEINNASLTVVRKGSLENCRTILGEVKRVGARVCVGSDAHDASLVGELDRALDLIDEVGLDYGLVVNRDSRSVLEFLSSRGKDIQFPGVKY
jgi:putative hydrolase